LATKARGDEEKAEAATKNTTALSAIPAPSWAVLEDAMTEKK